MKKDNRQRSAVKREEKTCIVVTSVNALRDNFLIGNTYLNSMPGLLHTVKSYAHLTVKRNSDGKVELDINS